MIAKIEHHNKEFPRNFGMMLEFFRVVKIIRDTHDTFTLYLKPPKGSFVFAPGQFNMLYLFGVGEVPISISGDPNIPEVLVHTIRAVGTVTKGLQKLKKGDYVGVRGPFGSRWPLEESFGNDIVIVGGGIGLAPLRPSIYFTLANREKFGKIVIVYGARTPNDILYKKELEQWRARFDVDVLITVDRAVANWHGLVGVVTTLIPRSNFDPLNSIAMVVGPEIMMRFTVQELQKRGVQQENIYVSMERNMKCGVGFCGHCQMGPTFICKDGPVYNYPKIKDIWLKREI